MSKVVPRELAVIVAEINTKLQNETAGVLEIGALLIEAKKQVKHGEWEKWLSGNFTLSSRTAQKYIKAHRWMARNELSSLLNLSPGAIYFLMDRKVYSVADGGINFDLDKIREAAKTQRITEEVIRDFIKPEPAPESEPEPEQPRVDDDEIEEMINNPTDVPPAPQEPPEQTAQSKADAAQAGAPQPRPASVKAKADRAETAPPLQPGFDVQGKADDAEQSADQRRAVNVSLEALAKFKEGFDATLRPLLLEMLRAHLNDAVAYTIAAVNDAGAAVRV